jgi:hypothetical protein
MFHAEKNCGSFGVFLQAWLLCLLSPAGYQRLLFGVAAKSANGFGHLITSHIFVPSFAPRTSTSRIAL